MLEVNVKEARAGFSKLLDKVEQGQHILLTRRGRKVARFIPPEQENRLPSLKAFRQEIARAGQGLMLIPLYLRPIIVRNP